MLNVEELKAALSEEIRVIRHLGTKVGPDQIDWRPTPGQRSTLELMRYMTICGLGPVKAMLAADWKTVGPMTEESEKMGLDGFDSAMEGQERALHAALDELGDAQLLERVVELPWGAKLPLGHAIFATSVRFLCAYRQQLFLYAKSSGADELSTYNAWMGVDPPAKPAS